MEDRFVICPVKGGPKSKQPYESIQILDTHNEDAVILEKDLYAPISLLDMAEIIDLLNKTYRAGQKDGKKEGYEEGREDICDYLTEGGKLRL